MTLPVSQSREADVEFEPVTAAAVPPSVETFRTRQMPLAGLIVVLLAALPFVASASAVSTLNRILALALLAVSLDLLVGVGGLPSLGHAAPFGVGAYAAALTAKKLSTVAPVQLLIAVAAGAVFSALVGWLVVRTRGTYLIMLTLAVAELTRTLADRWDAVTGGSNGLVGIPSATLVPGGEPVTLVGYRYWYLLTVAVVAFGLVVVVARSAFGRSLRGIRDNEQRMGSLGYSTFRVKFTVFVLAGAVAGAAGSLWVVQQRFVSPADLGFDVSALTLLAVIIGGRGSLWGAVLGAGLVVVLRDEIGSNLGGRGTLLLGLAFIAAVFLLPRGFAGVRLPGRRKGQST